MSGLFNFRRRVSARFGAQKIKKALKGEFDAAFYATIYCAVLPQGWDALDHYIAIGQFTGCDPSPDFSISYYLAAHKDVRSSGVEPYSHFLRSGRGEGRATQPSDRREAYERILLSRGFDESYYRSTVAEDEFAGMDALDHYRTTGWKRGYAPSSQFNVEHYGYMYPQITTSPLEDYVFSGNSARRHISARHAIMSGLVDRLKCAPSEEAFFEDLLDKALDLQPDFYSHWSQLCHGLDAFDKIHGFVYHWVHMFSDVKEAVIAKIMFDQVTLCDRVGADNRIVLYMSRPHANEGELSISFIKDEAEIFVLSFNVFPGHVFGYADENIILLTRAQGHLGKLEVSRQITKQLNDVTPGYAIFSALQGLARAWNITRIIAVSAERQASVTSERMAHFRQVYDAFFEANGGTRLDNGFYNIDLPIQQKPLTMIKRDHRARTRVKRALKASIENNAHQNMTEYLRPVTPRRQGGRPIVNDEATLEVAE